jgi:glutaredoxin 2
MNANREQFNIQKKRAQQTADFYKIPLEVVIVKNKNEQTRISIIGNAINPAIVEIWKKDGAKVRTICKIQPMKA